MQAERKRDGWAVTHVARTVVYPQQAETERLYLTPKQRDIAMECRMAAIQRKFYVQEPSPPRQSRANELGVSIGG